MKPRRHLLLSTTHRSHLLLSTTHRRHYSTKYTAKITSTSSTGRFLSAEVSPPPTPTDPRGYPLPRRHLICKATHLLLDRHSPSSSSMSPPPDPFLSLAHYLHSLSLSLTPAEASEILKSLNQPRLALEFFQFCPTLSPHFKHNSFTYNRLLLILSKSSLPDRLHLVRSVVSEMEKSNIPGSISTVNILIGIFGDTEDLERCIELVQKWDLRMNSYTYKCLLQAYLRSHHPIKAFGVYMDMRRHGYKLDIFAYNMLLDALAKDHKLFNRLTRLTRFLKT